MRCDRLGGNIYLSDAIRRDVRIIGMGIEVEGEIDVVGESEGVGEVRNDGRASQYRKYTRL